MVMRLNWGKSPLIGTPSPPFCLVYLYLCHYLSLSLSLSLSVCLSLWLSLCLSICLSLCLSLLCPALLFSALSVCLSFFLYNYLSLYLSLLVLMFCFSFSFLYILGECGRKESTTEIRERYRRQCHYGMCGIFLKVFDCMNSFRFIFFIICSSKWPIYSPVT